MSSDPDRPLREADLAHVWHPYTQMQTYAEREPPIVEEAEGRKLKDTDGNWYWDGVSSVWLNVHGHRVDAIDEAIRDQLAKVAHSTLLGQGNVPSIRLAERLAEHAPDGLTRVFYQDNGSGAVEGALKMALQHWHQRGEPERTRVISFEGGYHGETLGAVGVAPVDTFHAPFLQRTGEAIQVPYPDRSEAKDEKQREQLVLEHVEALEERLEAHAHEAAALFLEPLVQGVAGIRVMPEGFLSEVERLCEEHDVLLAADEVATGFGRTGRMFACDHEDVEPDLMALGKGITGGYLPLAATLATDEIHETFLGDYEDGVHLYHGHSYTGNQLGCAAAIANIDLLEDLLPELPDRARTIREGLEELAQEPHVGRISQRGFLCGIGLTDGDGEPLAAEARPGWAVAERARELGLLVRPIGPTVIFTPPLASTDAELAEMTELLGQAVADVQPRLTRIAEGGGSA